MSHSRICPHCRNRTDARLCADDGYKTVDASLYTDEHNDPLVGTVFEERYELLECIGSGGMGKVYRATQLAVDRPVAIKILRTHMAGDLREVARFQQEARALAALSHPNIIALYDFGQAASGALYLVMEFLEGEELSKSTKAGMAFEADAVVRIGGEMLDALADAHLQGVIHRDLKPANIFLAQVGRRQDVIKVLDFGIAKVFGENSAEMTLTKTGMTIGSPRYMAPEQALGGAIGPPTDLYSVGVILYELLCGRPIFQAESPTGYVLAHVNQVPQWPTRGDRRLEGPLVTLIMSMLNKDPACRGETAVAVLARLRACAGVPVSLGAYVVAPGMPADKAAAIATGVLPQVADATMISQSLEAAVVTGLAPQAAGQDPGNAQRRVPLWIWGAAAVAVAAVVAIASGGDDAAPASDAATASKVDAVGSSAATPKGAAGLGAATAAGKAVESADQPTDTKFQSTLKSTPSGAAVLIGGTLVGKTPFEARWTAGEAPSLELRLAGYEAVEVKLVDSDGEAGKRHVTLKAKPDSVADKAAADKAAADKAAADKAAADKAAADKAAADKAVADKAAADKAAADKAASDKAASDKAAADKAVADKAAADKKAAAEKKPTKKKKKRAKKSNPYKRI